MCSNVSVCLYKYVDVVLSVCECECETQCVRVCVHKSDCVACL